MNTFVLIKKNAIYMLSTVVALLRWEHHFVPDISFIFVLKEISDLVLKFVVNYCITSRDLFD